MKSILEEILANKISELNTAHAKLQAKVAELEEDWLELEMAKEKI